MANKTKSSETKPTSTRKQKNRATSEAPPTAKTEKEELLEIQAEITTVEQLKISAWRWFRFAAIVGSLLILYQLFIIVGGILAGVLHIVLYIAFGGILALIVSPFVTLFYEKLKFPKVLAILISLLGVAGAFGFIIYLLAGNVINEAHSLSNQLPEYLSKGQSFLKNVDAFLGSHGIHIATESLTGQFNQVPGKIAEYFYSGVTTTFQVAIDILVTFVTAFWLLKDGEFLRNALDSFLPSKLKPNVNFFFDAVKVVVGGYIRAQLAMAISVGTFVGIGCAILGVPYPLIIGILVGIFDLVPIAGSLLGGLIAILIATTVSLNLALYTLILIIMVHILEGYIVAPRLQEKFIRLHPLVSLMALLTGIEIGGILGALFALPVASLVAVFLRSAIGDWKVQRPDLFAAPKTNTHVERRRYRILSEFKLLRESHKRQLKSFLPFVNKDKTTPDGQEKAEDSATKTKAT